MHWKVQFSMHLTFNLSGSLRLAFSHLNFDDFSWFQFIQEKFMALYFIALIPEGPIKEKIKNIKLEVAAAYGAKHALKLPAHITMQIPFKLDEQQERTMLKVLNKTAEKHASFTVAISGFGAFPPRVLFLNIDSGEELYNLQRQLQHELEEHNLIVPKKQKPFHPHITIATRDLNEISFNAAWSKFQIRKFFEEWEVKEFYILKHLEKEWRILESFPLRETNLLGEKL